MRYEGTSAEPWQAVVSPQTALWHGHSARATSAAELRYRMQSPNSSPPRIVVVPLGERSAALVRPVCAGLSAVTCWRVPALMADEALFDHAHAMVIVAAGNELAFDASWLAERARARRMMVTGLVVESADTAAGIMTTVAMLRSHCSMLVVSADTHYVQGMLEALGAG